MAGSVAQGKKAARTMKAKFGDDYFVKMGAGGGRNSGTGGFYANPELAKTAGKKGGLNSGKTWTPERRAAHSVKIKQAWAKKKKPLSVKLDYLFRDIYPEKIRNWTTPNKEFVRPKSLWQKMKGMFNG